MRKLSLILALVLIAATLGCVQMGIAFAASETIYTGVLEDLQKDETFDVAAYPAKTELSDKDKVMDVIQIAESNAGELFLYVYQPQAGKFTATEARISQTVGDDIAPDDYKLTLLDRNGALEKYKVEQLQLKSDTVRYYFILQLARPWDKDVDGSIDSDNKVGTVPYGVEKLFTAATTDGSVTYSERHEEVRAITAKYCGYIRNFEGWVGVFGVSGDSHFVAFDTDIRIDNLLKATVTYDTVLYTYKESLGIMQIGSYQEIANSEQTNLKAELDADNVVDTPRLGLFSKKYSWTEIQSVEDFLKLEDLSDEAREQVQGKQWVLRFALTNFVKAPDGSVLPLMLVGGTRVTDVTILELTYMKDNVLYHMGVVDNKQTEGDKPSNPTPESKVEDALKRIEDFFATIGSLFDKAGKFFAKYWWVIPVGLVAIGLIVWLIIAIVKNGAPVVFKAIGTVLWWILKIIFYIVTLPVWIVIWIVQAARKNKQ